MNNGVLLNSLRKTLKQTVLPHVEDPAAKRQLKAALHMIGRMGKCWDLAPAVLRADIADMQNILEALEQHVAGQGHEFVPPQPAQYDDASDGYNDPNLAAMAQRHYMFCARAEGFESFARSQLPLPLAQHCLNALEQLYARMTKRDLIANGDSEFSENDELMKIET